MAFDLTHLGRWSAEVEYKVTADAIARYAAATNDDNPRHAAGDLAPPIFAVVPTLVDVTTAAISKVWLSEMSGYDIRRVHGEEDLLVHRPIVPGMILRSRAACVGVIPKRSACLLVTKTETRDEVGLVNQASHVTFIRGLIADGDVGEPPPSKVFPSQPHLANPYATVRHWVDADQSFRYAKASRDYGTYHLDEEAARDAGFPGVIVHGLCTMAFATRALVEAACNGDSTRLKRLAVRFTRPLRPGQEIVTKIWEAGDRDSRVVYAFEVNDASGQAVIRQGLAEVQQ